MASRVVQLLKFLQVHLVLDLLLLSPPKDRGAIEEVVGILVRLGQTFHLLWMVMFIWSCHKFVVLLLAYLLLARRRPMLQALRFRLLVEL